MQTTVIDNIHHTPLHHTLILAKPEGFTFKPGQFVMLQDTVDGKPLRRAYTIASSPTQQHIHITIRTQENGKLTPQLKTKHSGDTLTLLGPYGEFTQEEGTSMFLAGGSGITPFLSYLRANPNQHATLLYSDKTTHLYHEELLAYSNLTYIPTKTQENWNGKTGRITKEDIKEHLTEQTTVYLCGSNIFIRAMLNYLNELGHTQYKTENFGNITS